MILAIFALATRREAPRSTGGERRDESRVTERSAGAIVYSTLLVFIGLLGLC